MDPTPTLIQLANSSAPLIIQSSVESNWTQFTMSIITMFITSFAIFFIIGYQSGAIRVLIAKLKLRIITRRPTTVIRHNEAGLFNIQMIDQKTMNKIARFLNENNKKEINIILHTPGGVIFHSQAIADLINKHGKVHIYVPLMAMSGGTLLSLSAYNLYMGRSASLGPIDPQIGGFFSQGSADSWRKVMKIKKSKAKDESITYSNEGEKYTREIYNHLVKLGITEEVARFLTKGNIPHGKRFTIEDVKGFRHNVKEMTIKEEEICIKGVT